MNLLLLLISILLFPNKGISKYSNKVKNKNAKSQRKINQKPSQQKAKFNRQNEVKNLNKRKSINKIDFINSFPRYNDILLISNNSIDQTFDNSVNYVNGYILMYLFQNNLQCSDEIDLIMNIELNNCLSSNELSLISEYENFYYNSASNIYAIIQSTGIINNNIIQVIVNFYNDQSCSYLSFNNTQIFNLTTACTSVESDNFLSSRYFTYVSDINEIDIPGPGVLFSYYNNDECNGTSAEQYWRGPMYCSDGVTYSCSASSYGVTVYEYIYSNNDCTGTYEQGEAVYETTCLNIYRQNLIISCYDYTDTTNPCLNSSEIIYSLHGDVSIMESFQLCLDNIGGDGVFFPGYNTKQHLNVSLTVSLNNIISLDELTSTVTLDFFLLFIWFDPRLYMPDLFDVLETTELDITPAMGQSNIYGFETGIWVPSLLFPDAESIDVTYEWVRLKSSAQVNYNQHVVISILQSSFKYSNYPNDNQMINLRMYEMNIYASKMSFNPVSVSYIYSSSGSYSVTLNPLWTFQNAYAVSTNESPGEVYQPRPEVTIFINISRKSIGIVTRMAVPMFLLVLLAILAFWADPADRVNSTITMLLAISALYIVVLQNIPMVGYLTDFDSFVLFMFISLFLCCVLHLATIRLSKDVKLEKWPLRILLVRMIELIGRVFMLPLITVVYFYYFKNSYSMEIFLNTCILVGIFIILIIIRESNSMYKYINITITNLINKKDNLEDLSFFERLANTMIKWFNKNKTNRMKSDNIINHSIGVEMNESPFQHDIQQ